MGMKMIVAYTSPNFNAKEYVFPYKNPHHTVGQIIFFLEGIQKLKTKLNSMV
jgi:hypothetical protein